MKPRRVSSVAARVTAESAASGLLQAPPSGQTRARAPQPQVTITESLLSPPDRLPAGITAQPDGAQRSTGIQAGSSGRPQIEPAGPFASARPGRALTRRGRAAEATGAPGAPGAGDGDGK
jgi:hypothetical protein